MSSEREALEKAAEVLEAVSAHGATPLELLSEANVVLEVYVRPLVGIRRADVLPPPARCACGRVLNRRARERTVCRPCQLERQREGVRRSWRRRKGAL